MAISMPKADIPTLLVEHEVLCRLPAEALHTLVHGAALRSYDERGLIFSHGDPGRSVIVILHGYVKLSVILLNGSVQT